MMYIMMTLAHTHIHIHIAHTLNKIEFKRMESNDMERNANLMRALKNRIEHRQIGRYKLYTT